MAITACYRIEEENSPATETKELTITATREAPDTKTERQSNGDVYWNPSDAISLFFRSGTNVEANSRHRTQKPFPLPSSKEPSMLYPVVARILVVSSGSGEYTHTRQRTVATETP